MRTRCRNLHMFHPRRAWIMLVYAVLWSLCLTLVHGMRGDQIKELRQETERMFYHGYENYLEHAFPEDELRPLTCGPLTRDDKNAEQNDVLGNYTLTLIDSLSTLAILSSSPESGDRALTSFQDGVKEFVRLYGDGSSGPAGQGERARGFDIDSKVQVFETVIRGLGGLLSSHLFAIGELPISGYGPTEEEAAYASAWDKSQFSEDHHGIVWDNSFVYDGQFLRLAVDLTHRLLPAFYTGTGLPYPRVNLRHGIPFYGNSPLNTKTKRDQDQSPKYAYMKAEEDITETCSAGAGSLVLEFTVLSRLTGDGRYEELAKRAFWAVWSHRSEIGLIGFGIDAESGKWVGPYSGIGAGIDSFFEYAFKSHVLLSQGERPAFDPKNPWAILDDYYLPLTDEEHSADAFLQVWEDSHNAINRHLYRGEGYQHPHLIVGDVSTGATRAFWIDSLSAYYPGLLALDGKIDEAIQIHLLTTAVWTRYSALPERWNVATGDIEGGLSWYGGRPEFIESTYYIYRATQDPWYLHVGEMVLRDLKRRCWTKCGWAGLRDVKTGEMIDRMESFFLGETAKYMFLLFSPDHPLNKLDAPWVFTTEGHPLVIPQKASSGPKRRPSRAAGKERQVAGSPHVAINVCQAPVLSSTFGVSLTASRSDIFHAASLARLHLRPQLGAGEGPILQHSPDHPSVSVSDLSSPTNYTFYPWTLPPQLVPFNGTSAPMALRPTMDISFPSLPGGVNLGSNALERVRDGVFVKSIGGLRLSMIQDVPLLGATKASELEDGYRVQVINNVPLGKDEKVYISRQITFDVVDPYDPNFTRVRDTAMLDLVIDVLADPSRRRNGSTAPGSSEPTSEHPAAAATANKDIPRGRAAAAADASGSGAVHAPDSPMKTILSSLLNTVSSLIRDDPDEVAPLRLSLPASIPTGIGAAPLPEVEDAMTLSPRGIPSTARLTWSTIYFAGDLCSDRILRDTAQTHEVLVIKRGGCTFSQKMRNIAAFRPGRSSLKLVVIVSYDETESATSDASSAADADGAEHSSSNPQSIPLVSLAAQRAESALIRPHLDETQMTASGIPRSNMLSMVMVGGGEETYALLQVASGVGIRRRYSMRSRGVPITNVHII
ncbi:Alpha-mannosidase [Penicillium ucsense]|uniref:alpha-1,2-Mannosidase n=1 Tax=Penicillium ucsense TaxID=2839758 RepID=A0A8J8WGV2_9EURO|nr:Alpha-mannosidase [Penicillium ucsense]KAF7733364.1 Alpha-mannosidase [Penicillium ucsense]